MPKKKFFMLLALSALATTALALVSASVNHIATPTLTSSFQPQQTEEREPALPDEHVRLRSLMSPLRAPLVALGDRLEKRGKERVSLTGTLLRTGSEETPLAAVWERPGRLRLEEYGSRQRLAIFDGQMVSRSQPAEAFDDALLETLLYDSAEHFFVSQMQGAATRSLGERFRLIEDSEAKYDGPSYDVFEVTEQVALGSEAREQSRQYFFNSDTHLLDLVRYEVLRQGAVTRVEVRLENWQQVNGQRYAGKVVRLENNAPIVALNLNLASATVSPKLDDGLFKQ